MKIEMTFETTKGSYPQDVVNVFFRDDQGHYTGVPALLLGIEQWKALKAGVLNALDETEIDTLVRAYGYHADDECGERKREPSMANECGG